MWLVIKLSEMKECWVYNFKGVKLKTDVILLKSISVSLTQFFRRLNEYINNEKIPLLTHCY